MGENGWEILDWDDLSAHYTSGQENRYFDWPDAPGKSARQLAAMFVERFPKIAAAGVGRDYAYAGWYIEMLGTAENGELPIFYSDWHDKPPPPAIPPTILRA